MTPAISVVVPTHRRPRQLLACLEALAACTPPPGGAEVVVVDDGGDVPLERVVGQVVSPTPIRLVRQENTGPAGARNRGVAAARAPLVAFTDDDCRPDPRWLVAMVEALGAHDHALVAGEVRNALADQPTTVASETIVRHLVDWSATHDDVVPFAPTNNAGAPRRDMLELGGFDEGFPLAAGEDRALAAAWAASGRPVVLAPAAVVDHAHDLDLLGFVRQHHAYGRGGARFAASQASAGRDPTLFKGLGFYTGLLRRALADGGPVVLLLVLVAQVATAAGNAVERVAALRRTDGATGDLA